MKLFLLNLFKARNSNSKAVVDQEGLRIFLIGLILALFFGLIFKAQIRPKRITQKLQSLILSHESSLDGKKRRIQISFQKGEVNLSDWGIPSPGLAIYGLKLSPNAEGCSENQVFIDKLFIPVKFSNLFKVLVGQKVGSLRPSEWLNTIYLSQVEIRIDDNKSLDCFLNPLKMNNELSSHEPENSLPSRTSHQQLQYNDSQMGDSKNKKIKSDSFENENQMDLVEVNIDQIKVILKNQLRSALDFRSLQGNLSFSGKNLIKTEIVSKLNAFKDSQKKLNLVKSEIKFISEQKKINEQWKTKIDLDINGSMIDKNFSFKIKNNLDNQKIQLLGEFNSVSLKGLNQLLHAEKPELKVYDFLSGSAVSGFITGEFDLLSQNFDISLKKISGQIADGSFEINEVKFDFDKSKNSQIQIRPFDAQLNSIDFSRLLPPEIIPQLRSSLEKFGRLSGQLQFVSQKKIKLKALIEEASFVFSNQGRRAYQTVDSFNLTAQLDGLVGQKQTFHMNDFIVDSEKINGFVHFDQENEKEANLSINLAGHLLKAETIQLFTQYKFIPKIQIQFSTNFNDKSQGKAFIDEFKFEDFLFKDLKLNFSKNLKTQQESYSGSSEFFEILNSEDQKLPFLQEITQSTTVEKFQKTQFSIEKSTTKQFNFKFNASSKIQSLIFFGFYNNDLKSKLTYKTSRPEISSVASKSGLYKSNIRNFDLSGPLNSLKLTPLK